MNNDKRINELYSTITDLSHATNINKDAFKDISNVLLSFHDSHNIEGIKQVCNASMGHGKSTVLESYLIWITKQRYKQPVLIAIREKQLAHRIYKKVSNVSHSSIINLDADNKNLYESDLHKYQIVIIQHQRLKNFGLGFGNPYNYSYYNNKSKERIKRLLIIDEKPDFIDSAIFDITKDNNVLEWFDNLAEPLNILPRTLQKHKSYITFLLSEELADNNEDITQSLFRNESNNIRSKGLLSVLNEMKEHENNKNKYESLNKLKHFKKLLKVDGYGRIDDYVFNSVGRKIIVSKYIDYSSLGMNILVFDGTAAANVSQYVKGNYKGIPVINRNDYTRLNLHTDKINTSKYSRNKPGNPTQKAISKRINELQNIHNDLFILPMKEEIKIYLNEKAIKENDKQLYFDNEEDQTKGINLLNTIGKNQLNDVNSLYLTCLPKRNADYYKQIAIALYDVNVSLMTSEDTDNSKWFQDTKLESVYKGDLYAELLQIIHRTALRNIDKKDTIDIYIAFDDEPTNLNNSFEHEPILENIKRIHLKSECNLSYPNQLYDMTMYNRDKTLDKFIQIIKDKNINGLTSVGKISQSFRQYLKKHYDNKQAEIDHCLSEAGYKIVLVKDRYADNSKYINKL
ncbi:hypothetical protein [Metabacillus sp. Hm71]|uniref:hypothetical protein n=1 Tax=Metabacillus sp. Hm71 TaxID=3450743 RepID=UPI003F43CB81